jgi:hypothetical protein
MSVEEGMSVLTFDFGHLLRHSEMVALQLESYEIRIPGSGHSWQHGYAKYRVNGLIEQGNVHSLGAGCAIVGSRLISSHRQSATPRLVQPKVSSRDCSLPTRHYLARFHSPLALCLRTSKCISLLSHDPVVSTAEADDHWKPSTGEAWYAWTAAVESQRAEISLANLVNWSVGPEVSHFVPQTRFPRRGHQPREAWISTYLHIRERQVEVKGKRRIIGSRIIPDRCMCHF